MQKIIGVVGLGVYRDVAASMDTTFLDTPYQMVAVIDLKNKVEAVRYTAHNLSVVLHSLTPRPRCFVTGAAISGEITNESIQVWEEYVKATGVTHTLLINLHKEPPADGDWRSEIMRKLDAKYRSSEG